MCAADYMISSYTPSITALANAYRDPPRSSVGAEADATLLVAVPSASGYAPLPNTAREVDLVREIVGSAQVLAGDVRADTFLDALRSAKFLHLACHGKQDAQDALRSGFVFHDEMVRLETLMDAKVERGCFAFFSACESAMGDKTLPDEAISLAAAMFFIGYRSIVGTLW